MSAHKLPRRYQQRWVTLTAWTVWVTWCTFSKLARSEIEKKTFDSPSIYLSIYLYIYIYIVLHSYLSLLSLSMNLYIVLYSYLSIYLSVGTCRKKWVESDRMYVEKVKLKKNMFAGLFISQRFSTSIFFECQSVLSKLF